MLLALLLLALAPQNSHTAENLRGVSTPTQQIAWASGTHGTYLRTTDAGKTWLAAQVPGAESLDFRAVVAFTADEAFLMSAGPGDQSRIYHTTNGGRHWSLQFANKHPQGFFDSMVFWDRTHGIVLGDPIPDASGISKFELLLTEDGETWKPLPSDALPAAQNDEGAFAASNSCIAVLPAASKEGRNAKGPDAKGRDTDEPALNEPRTNGRGEPAANQRNTTGKDEPTTNQTNITGKDEPTTNQTNTTGKDEPTTNQTNTTGKDEPTTNQTNTTGKDEPTMNQTNTTGKGTTFSRAVSSKKSTGASAPGVNIWFATGGAAARVFHSPDGGKTWEVTVTPIMHGPDSAGIFSIAFRDATHGVIAGGDYKQPTQDGPNLAFTTDGGRTWTLSPIHPQQYFSAASFDHKSPKTVYIVAPDSVLTINTSTNSKPQKSTFKLNAVSPLPKAGILGVGPKGQIVRIPHQ
jgi:photosystem II stability/assembly factor-like uncharacterized protein